MEFPKVPAVVLTMADVVSLAEVLVDLFDVAEEDPLLELVLELSSSLSLDSSSPPNVPEGATLDDAAATAFLYASRVWLPEGLTTPTMPLLQWPV